MWCLAQPGSVFGDGIENWLKIGRRRGNDPQDVSRGGLLLRQVAADVELPYVPVAGAVRHGPRPPKLTTSCLDRR